MITFYIKSVLQLYLILGLVYYAIFVCIPKNSRSIYLGNLKGDEITLLVLFTFFLNLIFYPVYFISESSIYCSKLLLFCVTYKFKNFLKRGLK